MKKLALLFLLALPFTFCKASDKKIIATIVFENATGKTFKSGEFYSYDTNQKIQISTLDSFKIALPEKGKYQFSFYTSDFETYTIYPAFINENKNTITIKLVEKVVLKELSPISIGFSKPLSIDRNLTEKQIEQLIISGQAHFIMHGLNNEIPDEYIVFQKKYGVFLKKENCILDPLTFKATTQNNQIIANYLTQKYGDAWLLDLATKPFGIKQNEAN